MFIFFFYDRNFKEMQVHFQTSDSYKIYCISKHNLQVPKTNFTNEH